MGNTKIRLCLFWLVSEVTQTRWNQHSAIRYGLDGIEYEDAVPNFDECAEETVEIDMTENRYSNVSEGIVGNFEKADTECAKKWNAEGKDGKTDWTARDAAD